jgi:hypothetical protein
MVYTLRQERTTTVPKQVITLHLNIKQLHKTPTFVSKSNLASTIASREMSNFLQVETQW